MSLLLSRADIAALMTNADYLEAVETAFMASKKGRAHSPPPLHIPADDGAFHAKGARLDGPRKLVALKLNANFPGNPARGLPTIQGMIALCDAEIGALLAIMDSIEITLRRTAAASALAARHLARAESKVFAICGCGAQARPQTEALAALFRFECGFAWDIDREKAQAFARAMEQALKIPFSAAEMRAATGEADVIVTCTTARTSFLTEADISPGVFIAAVGADSADKNEIAASLMAKAKVVVDVLDQCLVMGDLHHAVTSGAMTAEDVHADLGEIVTGAKLGRTTDDEIIIFDSTGTALQDVASAALAYNRAQASSAGQTFAFT